MGKFRYRKKFFESSTLPSLYHQSKDIISKIKFDLLGKKINPCEATAIFLIHFYLIFHPNLFGSKRKSVSKVYSWKLENLNYFSDQEFTKFHPIQIFTLYHLRSCPLRINEILIRWFESNLPILLSPQDPSPMEMLRYQAKGIRTITLPFLKASYEMKNDRDPLSFILHDLFHADRFFLNSEIYEGQISFYNKIIPILKTNELSDMLNNPEFKIDFNYLIADMNTHPEHQKKYLKAILQKHNYRGNLKFMD